MLKNYFCKHSYKAIPIRTKHGTFHNWKCEKCGKEIIVHKNKMKLFFGAIKTEKSLVDYSIVAKNKRHANRLLKTTYNNLPKIEEVVLVEQDIRESEEYFCKHPDKCKEGIYNNPPYGFAVDMFCN